MTRARSQRRARQAGMTLIEIMISIAIIVVMMAMARSTISNAARTRELVEATQLRNQELRNALQIAAADFSEMYLSQNEDQNQANRRTQLIAHSGSKVPDVRFSTLGHRVYWADAHESSQTVINYSYASDRVNGSQTDWMRREQRRVSNRTGPEEAAELDVLVHDIDHVKIEFWDWPTEKWLEDWNTTDQSTQRNRLPLRVRITIFVKGADGSLISMSTQARVLLQEQLSFATQ